MKKTRTFNIGEHTEINVVRSEANFDRACDTAYGIALWRFGADEDGYLNNIEANVRSTDSIMIEFVKYRRVNHEHLYDFVCWVDRHEILPS